MVGILVRNARFRVFVVANLVSLAGDWLLRVALTYFVFQRTHSALASGGVFVLGMLPQLLGPVAGAIADVGDRKRTMVLAQLAGACCIPGLLVVTHAPALLWVAYPVVFLDGLVAQVSLVTRQAVIPSLVAREELAEANSVAAVVVYLAGFLGPVLSGLILAVTSLDVLVVLDLATFVVAAVLLASIPGRLSPSGTAAGAARRSFVRMIGEGLDLIRRTRDLRRITAVAAVLMLCMGLFNALAVPFASGDLGFDSRGVGVLYGVFGAANLAVAPVAAVVSRRFAIDAILAAGLLVKGVAFLAMATVRVPALEFAFFAVLGTPDLVLLVAGRSTIQLQTPSEQLGRVLGTMGSTLNASMLAGAGIASIAAQPVGARWILTAAGAIVLMAAAVTAVSARTGERAVASAERS